MLDWFSYFEKDFILKPLHQFQCKDFKSDYLKKHISPIHFLNRT